MTRWTEYPNLRGLAVPLFTLAILAVGIDGASAQSGRFLSSSRLAQSSITTTPLPGTRGRGLFVPGTVTTPGRITLPPATRTPTGPTSRPGTKTPSFKWPTAQPRPRNPTVKWPTYRPRPRTPTVSWPKPKRPNYARPRPRPGKKINTVKRTPQRRLTPPPVLKTIPQFLPNEALVLVTSDQPDTVGSELAAAFGLTVVETVRMELLNGAIIRFRYPDNRPLRDVIALLTSDPRVSNAGPNNYYHPLGSKKKRSKKRATQYSLAKLSIGAAHEIAKGRGISVAVIDTGIDTRHPVLSKAVAQSFNAVGDGKTAVGKHGTAIAGLIAGQGRVQGVAPLSRLLAVRAFSMNREYNKPMTSGMILLRALDWSFANKARIFNMSFAGPYDPLVKKALEAAYEKGVILVAAAGNGGLKAAPAYPAAYKNVIAITALDSKDKLYAHANRGSYLTAAAPGVDMLVPSLKKGYTYSSGTSLAAAQISGLIALLLERNPEASAEIIVNAIQKGAFDLGPKGYDTQFGAGRADALASLIRLDESR